MKKDKKSKLESGKKRRYSASEAGLAFKHSFYLETVWILSVIFEKRAKDFLTRIDGTFDVRGFTFDQSLKRIKFLQGTGRIPAIGKFIDLTLMDGMHKWKTSRNKLFKDIPLIHVSESRMERAAIEGIGLYKKWNKALKHIKNEMNKQSYAEERKPSEVAGE